MGYIKRKLSRIMDNMDSAFLLNLTQGQMLSLLNDMGFNSDDLDQGSDDPQPETWTANGNLSIDVSIPEEAFPVIIERRGGSISLGFWLDDVYAEGNEWANQGETYNNLMTESDLRNALDEAEGLASSIADETGLGWYGSEANK